jgi:hypothetical protein
MARLRERVCLEDGLRLDLNELLRDGSIVSGAGTSRTTFWQNAATCELVAVAVITADLTDWSCPRVRIRMSGLDQTIDLIAQHRRFGGVQWYFRCPVLSTRASVLWKPPGATRFCSRQAWGNEVAYHTQFMGRTRRARIGRERIKTRLGWDHKRTDDWHLLPPKPRWMRWATYDGHIERYCVYEEVLLNGMEASNTKLSAKLTEKFGW